MKEEITRILCSHFSPVQISAILNQDSKRISKWSEQDISTGLTIKCISAKAYKYIRDVLKLPFPSPTTLLQLTSSIKCEPGLLKSVLRLMQCKSPTMSATDRVCIILFDEMSISPKYVYDEGSDTLYRPHSKAQVVMIKGLFSSWTQPIFFDFDSNMTLELFFSLLKAIYDIGLEVVGAVSDLGPSNRGLLKQLGVTPANFSIVNPYNSQRIHFFDDAPHLLKLIRNNFIDHGFKYLGQDISPTTVAELLRCQSSDLKIAYKVSECHLSVVKTDRQNVKLAAQLLSQSVGNTLKHYGSLDKIKNAC